MNEGRCKDCKFWTNVIHSIGGTLRGVCHSEKTGMHTRTQLMPLADFGCINWQAKGLVLRDRLAEFVNELLSHLAPGEHGYVSLGAADDIITIYEEWLQTQERLL